MKNDSDLQVDSGPTSTGFVWLPAAAGDVPDSSDGLSELSRWLLHDDGTINIVLNISKPSINLLTIRSLLPFRLRLPRRRQTFTRVLFSGRPFTVYNNDGCGRQHALYSFMRIGLSTDFWTTWRKIYRLAWRKWSLSATT